jgi:hypothetical protein
MSNPSVVPAIGAIVHFNNLKHEPSCCAAYVARANDDGTLRLSVLEPGDASWHPVLDVPYSHLADERQWAWHWPYEHGSAERADEPSQGRHNLEEYGPDALFDRTFRGDSYHEKSVVMFVPSITPRICLDTNKPPHDLAPRDSGIPLKVVDSWLSLQTPANHKFTRRRIENCEVADAYNHVVALILGDDELSTWRYLLTVETDNIPPPTGLLQLVSDMEASRFDAMGGIYWMKGEDGVPMAYGRPEDIPRNMRPFVPPAGAVTPVNGLGMGFTLFSIDMFKRIPPPWFKTVHEWIPGAGMERYMTQDMYFFEHAAKYGFSFAVNTKVRVGHLDDRTGIVW